MATKNKPQPIIN